MKDQTILKEKEFLDFPSEDLVIALNWSAPVELDLWCFLKGKNGRIETVGFNNRCDLRAWPYATIDQHVRGSGKQVLRLKTMNHIEHAFILVNVYAKKLTNFASNGCTLVISSDTTEHVLPVSNKNLGTWCVMAHLDGANAMPILTNLNQTVSVKPKLQDLIDKYGARKKKLNLYRWSVG